MKSIILSERTIRIAVIILSITGISLLVFIAALSEVEKVELSRLDEHNGDTIRTEGIVVGQDIMSTGSSRLLIIDEEGNSAEVFIERSKIRIDPGSVVSVKGDVYAEGDTRSITLQSDSGIETVEDKDPSPFHENIDKMDRISEEVLVVSFGYKGYYGMDMIVRKDGEEGPIFLDVEVQNSGYDIRTGDLIELDGIYWSEDLIKCYGSESTDLIYRSKPVTSSLLELLSALSSSPANVPPGKFSVAAYIKYEPGFGSLYVSDDVQGSSVSLKVEIPAEGDDLHMGDLVRLVNTTLLWDSDGLRYVLAPERIDIISSHGPWILNLENLEYGISPYEDAEVQLTGTLSERTGGTYLISGGSSIEVRGFGDFEPGVEEIITGYVRYDPKFSAHYIDPEEEIE